MSNIIELGCSTVQNGFFVDQVRSNKHTLRASTANTAVGRFENGRSPVLRIGDGDTVSVQTLNHFGDQISPTTTLEEIIQLRRKAGRCGPHTVTGPIFVEGAAPGDALSIRIGSIRPRKHGYNCNLPGREFPEIGALPAEFAEAQVRHYDLDFEHRKIAFTPSIDIPLRPFPGIVAVSPPDYQVLSTVEPGNFGGNMDLKELCEGSVLLLPVFVEGASLWVGDEHAGQWNREVT